MTDRDRASRTLRELQPYIERARRFSGWSFEGLRVRLLDPVPWGYESIAADHARNARSAVDLGTGGGEVYSRIIEGTRADGGAQRTRFVATEEWHVNAPVARDRLRPLGAHIIRACSGREITRAPIAALPFRDASFDLVLSRHEAFEPGEVARVLEPGGVFVTRQIAASYWREQRRWFDRTDWGDHFTFYQRAFRDLGFHVEARLHEGRMAYATLGDVVYMMLITPWEVEDFDPARDIDRLLEMEDALRTDDGIVFTHSVYLIVARKPSDVALSAHPA